MNLAILSVVRKNCNAVLYNNHLIQPAGVLMKNLSLLKVLFSATTLIAILLISSISNAQTATSTGRSNVITQSMNNDDYKKIAKIRRYINEGKFDKAEKEANKIIKTENRRQRFGSSNSLFYYEAYNGLCVSLTGAGKITEAMDACNKSIEMSPDSWESLKSRATLYYMTQNFPKSLEDFQLSLTNAPDNEAVVNVIKQNIGVVQSKIQ